MVTVTLIKRSRLDDFEGKTFANIVIEYLQVKGIKTDLDGSLDLLREDDYIPALNLLRSQDFETYSIEHLRRSAKIIRTRERLNWSR